MASSRAGSRAGGPRRLVGAVVAATAVAALGACSLVGADDGGDAGDDGADDGAASGDGGGTVVLVTHDSFALPDELVAAFEEETGYTLETRAPGDGGALVNQLILTKDAPLGDAVYGIDTTFATRAIAEGVLEPYQAADAVADYAVDDTGSLTAVDMGDVCINVDHEWFAERGIAEPATLEDLTDPAYRDLLVVTNPATSSPGLAFLLATVGAFGEDGWLDYWTALRDNGLKVASGWSDAYYVDFSGPSSEGDRPLVLSYASSPPYEVPEGATDAPTGALLDTCFRQVEYAGVLAGAANPEGARAVVDWLLSPEVQAAIPENMYMYPVTDVELPASWAQFAPLATEPFHVEPDAISANRDAWIEQWTDAVVG
ncbi:thiamine ABC transporter substrate-binding protein [Actinotalea fermentans]|uniref:Thiamine ABC transporter substrate-binding protein n=1 Tax=Actinotalea fermentans TaxID=43671 RepID=A0A511Z144_9CELL|nr:thiamine ABC transporter substrate-binding protein [Actinotalea fermentans]KGM15685.1 ABC transporter substrate-binding protein [Actinotalea fermentans ATCC 43279 = JCM 9966 = DSM 3133]GEN81180.1 thiamine ABC transporter substrate-binding protein [Actinotalea fermentans]